MLLSQGYVFDHNFLSQGYPIENPSRTPPSKNFRSNPPPPPPPPLPPPPPPPPPSPHLYSGVAQSMVCAIPPILHFVDEMPWFFSKTIKWGIMTQFYHENDYVIIFRLEILHCCINQGHGKCHSWLDLVTYDLEHEVRLIFHGLSLL